MYRKYVKRIFDIIFSLVMLPFVFLICLIIGPLIYLEDKGNIFYKAKRSGVNGKIFEMYKLRSMRMNAPDMRNADNSTYNSPDDPRITKIGKVIRKISVDELKELISMIEETRKS